MRAYFHMVIADGVASPLITVHNVAYQVTITPFLLLFYLLPLMFEDQIYGQWIDIVTFTKISMA